MENKGVQILGEGLAVSMNDIQTKLNNNILLIGSPGSGKTSLIKANLREATGSYIVSDPKAQLYKEFGGYLREKGYRVLCLEFKNINKKTSAHFNPFHYIKNEEDVLRMSSILSSECESKKDPFWDMAAALLYTSLIACLSFEFEESMRNIRNFISMINMAETRDADTKTELDNLFEKVAENNPESFAYRQYKRFRCMPTRTYQSVLITAQSKLAFLDSPAINEMTSFDEVDLEKVGQEPTAIFVSVSDTDRSLDCLANIFFTTAIQEVVRCADEKCRGGRLPIPVRFILDDFATNFKIEEFPRIITSIRSRNISSWVIVQSKSQLEKLYGDDDATIIAGCDHVVYQGGNDLNSAKYIAERTNLPLARVLGMKVGESIVIERGTEKPAWVKCCGINDRIQVKQKERTPEKNKSGKTSRMWNRAV